MFTFTWRRSSASASRASDAHAGSGGWVLCAALALMLGTIACAQDQDESLPRLLGIVTAITDGDTIRVRLDGNSDEIKIRFHAIDTPEKGQPGAEAAKQALSGLIFGKQVELEPFEQDQYARLVATVYLGGLDVNRELVKLGHAWAFRRYMQKSAPGYCSDEATARAAKLGVWGLQSDQIIAPWEWRRRKSQPEFTDYSNETVANCVAVIGKR